MDIFQSIFFCEFCCTYILWFCFLEVIRFEHIPKAKQKGGNQLKKINLIAHSSLFVTIKPKLAIVKNGDSGEMAHARPKLFQRYRNRNSGGLILYVKENILSIGLLRGK